MEIKSVEELSALLNSGEYKQVIISPTYASESGFIAGDFLGESNGIFTFSDQESDCWDCDYKEIDEIELMDGTTVFININETKTAAEKTSDLINCIIDVTKSYEDIVAFLPNNKTISTTLAATDFYKYSKKQKKKTAVFELVGLSLAMAFYQWGEDDVIKTLKSRAHYCEGFIANPDKYEKDLLEQEVAIMVSNMILSTKNKTVFSAKNIMKVVGLVEVLSEN